MIQKQFFDQGDRVDAVKKSLMRQIDYCNSEIGTMKSVDYSREYTTGTRDDSNSRDVKLILIRDDCEAKLKELCLRESEYKKQIEEGLAKMPEGNEMRALLHYHVFKESQREIGRLWGYSHTQIQRFLEKGYSQFPMPNNPIVFDL